MSDAADLKESHLRSVLKAISYRVVGTLTTWLLAWAVTGDLRVAFTIGALEPFLKTIVYYLHERAWAQVPRGKVRRLLRFSR